MRRSIVGCLTLLVSLLPLPHNNAWSGEDISGGAAVTSVDPASATAEKDAFEYQTANRPDPFKPFITEKAVVTPDSVIEVDTSQLSGLQKYEPGQLNLVAIMATGETNIAMVEDVTGQGFIVNEGTLIGARGIVSSIKSDQVIVTEIARTTQGKELVSTIIMRMKEGEK